jgi:hypothetical protein
MGTRPNSARGSPLARKLGIKEGQRVACAIDETWSGLRLVIRRKDRPGY